MLNTGKICLSLKEYIENKVLPQYESFDPAHRRDHAEKVIENSLQLARHHNADLNMAYTIAAYHDLGLCEGRERHHIVSGQILLADSELRRWFSPSQLTLMAEAVEDHRASKTGEPRSLYGKIVAEADRDIEPMKILRRTVQFGLGNYPELDKEQQWQRFVAHLNEKYAEGGYLRLWLPESPNAAKLEELRAIIADSQQLKRIFDQLFEKEK
ncbi:MAG: HD domain-containing protein [Bacteroidales bacterium]|nr:HD domain-containing protein [Bacteroidales bacterium]